MEQYLILKNCDINKLNIDISDSNQIVNVYFGVVVGVEYYIFKVHCFQILH